MKDFLLKKDRAELLLKHHEGSRDAVEKFLVYGDKNCADAGSALAALKADTEARLAEEEARAALPPVRSGEGLTTGPAGAGGSKA